MTRRAATVGLVIVTLTGCVRLVWMKPGVTDEEFRVDDYACERDMRQSGYFGGGFSGAMNAQTFYNKCMESKGYRKMREADPPLTRNAPPAAEPQPVDIKCPGNSFWNGFGCTTK